MRRMPVALALLGLLLLLPTLAHARQTRLLNGLADRSIGPAGVIASDDRDRARDEHNLREPP